MKSLKHIAYTIALSLLWLIITLNSSTAGHAGADGIVSSINKAPIIADGDVTGKPTDFVIDLDRSLDPSVAGRILAQGDQIRVIFPSSFDLEHLNPAFPLADLPTPSLPCLPGNLQCTTALILRGWPQDPPFPPAAFHTLSIDPAENALIFTALQDILDIKQLHLILHGVSNPKPGNYRIHVEAQTGPGGTWEHGSGRFRVLPQARPSVNVTSVFVQAWLNSACSPGTLPPNPDNPIYQTTGLGAEAPFVWTFLIWGKDKEPLTDIGLDWVNPEHARLKRGKKTIGHLYIDAPKGANGHRIEVNPLNCGTLLPAAPVIGPTPGIGPQMVGRLDLLFTTGDVPGVYTTTLMLNNGSSVQLFVTAQDE